MKKKQYIAAVACLLAGVIGFGSVYISEKAKEREQSEELSKAESVVTEKQEEPSQSVSGVVKPKMENEVSDELSIAQEKLLPVEEDTKTEEEIETIDAGIPEAENTSAANTLHFDESADMRWPLEGDVLLDYSMDSTIYFPTLEQYKYNPAIVIGGEVNSKVYLVAAGTITDISTNEETGCTVTQDLGDGYCAVYGQLKELNFAIGDQVERGQVIGYVSEPTKYYAVEGSNLYFQLLKDGEPVNPVDYFE